MIQLPDFDALYRADADPWAVASSFYEQRKLAVVLASLTQASYAAAWDPASGTGELAARLADRVRTVLATDASAEAVRLTERRCAHLPNVSTQQLRQPCQPERPEAGFELTVVSELVYYLSSAHRARLSGVLADSAAASAEIVLVHWRHRPHDGYLSGAEGQLETVQQLTTRHGWWAAVRHDDRDFVLDVLRTGPA